MQIKDLVRYLEQIAPSVYQESYDNAGLIVGDPNQMITGVLIALDSTEAVLEEAIQKQCNIVVAHHPIVFGGLKTFTGKNYVERVVMKAIKHDIAIYAAHTNLDNVYENGVNGKIAEKLGLEQCRILSPKRGILQKLCVFVPETAIDAVRDALFEAGAGYIGNYSECSFASKGEGSFKGNATSNPHVGEPNKRHYEPEQKLEVVVPKAQTGQVIGALLQAHPYEEVAYDLLPLNNNHEQVGSGMVGNLAVPMESTAFLKLVKEQLNTACIRHTAICTPTVQRVAVCGGAGSFLLNQAIRAKADVFITGDYKYHQFFDAENRIIIADVGHYESEQFTIELFYELLTQKFLNFAIHCTEVNTNPVNYL